MAKGRKGRKGGRHVTYTKFAGKSYDCYGKHVRSGKGRKKSPRVFCGKMDKK